MPILITGGTGSFGKTILRSLLEDRVDEVRIYSRDEEKQLDLKRECKDPRVKYILGDVRDYDRLCEATRNVNLVFHAAAQKIIDSCEDNPSEALKTNIIGSLNVKNACIRNNVEKAVLISTDKAVKPINLYGMTKAVAERLWIEGSSETAFIITRYGNVVGSRGSVVPFFKMLKEKNQALPITDYRMTRFLLTLKDAINLVAYATKHGSSRCIYIPELRSCRVIDLAHAIAGDDYPTKEVGIRQGEKLHECLIQEYEIPRTKLAAPKIFQVHPTNESDSLCYLTGEYTSDSVSLLSKDEIKAMIEEA